MSGGSAPQPPDYTGAAIAQGQANIEAARIAAQLNRVNQSGPGGSTAYTQDPNSPDTWTQTTSLSPEQLALYKSNTANQQGVSGLAGNQLNTLQGTLSQPFSVNGPERVSSVTPSLYKTDVNAPSVRYGDIDTSGLPSFGTSTARDYQASVDFSGAPALPGQNDFSAERQRVEDALYGSASKRLDDQYTRSDEDMRTRLLNSGLREGSEGWNNAMRDNELSKQDTYGNARDRAIAAGGAEQSRLFSDALAARGQSTNETLASGNFANQSSNLANLYGLNSRGQAASERGQAFGEKTAVAQFGNQATQQQFQNELSRLGLYNAGQETAFNQGSQNAELANAVRDAAMREQQTTRNQPLQEFLALYGDGGGGTGATGGNIASVAGPQAPNLVDATNNQYSANMNQYSADEQQRANNTNALIGIASMAAMYY